MIFSFCLIPNHFNRNRNRNRFVPVTIETVTICDICDQNVTKPVLLKKLKKTETNSVTHSNLWQFVTNTNVTNWSSIRCDWYKPVSVSLCKSGSDVLLYSASTPSLRESRNGIFDATAARHSMRGHRRVALLVSK